MSSGDQLRPNHEWAAKGWLTSLWSTIQVTFKWISWDQIMRSQRGPTGHQHMVGFGPVEGQRTWWASLGGNPTHQTPSVRVHSCFHHYRLLLCFSAILLNHFSIIIPHINKNHTWRVFRFDDLSIFPDTRWRCELQLKGWYYKNSVSTANHATITVFVLDVYLLQYLMMF